MLTMAFSFCLSTLLALFPLLSEAGTLQLQWTTDIDGDTGFGQTTFGPDGPWQAVRIVVGNSSPQSDSAGVSMPMWPSGSYLTEILTTQAGGNYSTNSSSSVVTGRGSLANSDAWFSSSFLNETSSGTPAYDFINLPRKLEGNSLVNGSISALKQWTIGTAKAKYTAKVGILGLGPNASPGPSSPSSNYSMLQQLKSSGSISSKTFSLHMGSAVLGQSGSLVLGGYDQNRVAGPVASFPLNDGIPRLFMADVVIEVENGGSPFNQTDIGSVYKGLGGSPQGTALTRQLGGQAGSAVMIPNPAAPYLYLPPGTCEAAASYLPVSWNASLGLYTWNTGDPQFARVVNSPAYIGFVLVDSTATNITIKIPFKLLNLTLESPLVYSPTQYFPCVPFNSTYGFWMLGRTFLQGAFMLVDFEHNQTLIAQAPGPNMNQSVIQTFNPSDKAINTTKSTFAQTWASSWTAIPEPATSPLDAPSSTNTTSPQATESGTAGDPDRVSPSTGAVVGISVACISTAAAVTLIGLHLWWQRRRRESAALATLKEQNMSEVETVNLPEADGDFSERKELAVETAPIETGNALPHEMFAPRYIHEAPATQKRSYYELPAEDVSIEKLGGWI